MDNRSNTPARPALDADQHGSGRPALHPARLLLMACASMVFSATALAGAPAALEEALAQLPVVDAAATRHTLADLEFHSADPARVRVQEVDGTVDPFALEDALSQVRIPTVPTTDVVPSLSHRVGNSPLSECNQLCSFSLSTSSSVPSNLMQFSCGDGRMVRLREYPDPDEGTAVSVARDQVNVLVNGRPGRLQRFKPNLGSGATMIVWRGSHHGYSLFLPGADDDAARLALRYAESLP